MVSLAPAASFVHLISKIVRDAEQVAIGSKDLDELVLEQKVDGS